MAGKSTQTASGTKSTKAATTKAATEATKPIKKIDIDNLNLDEAVTVRNISDWNVSFVKRHESGDMRITKNSTQRMSRNEIQAQVSDGNPLFVGVDGKGSHAGLFIEDTATRMWLGFETETTPQLVFNDTLAKNLFTMSQDEFEKNLPIYIVTRAEKYALMESIDRLKFNDYRKIMFASNYTGYPLT